MASYFEGTSGFNVRSLKIDNVDGDYTDERNTVIDKAKIRRTTYDQEGAVGVVNDHGRFKGQINYSGGPPPGERKKDHRAPPRSQTAPNAYHAETHNLEQDSNRGQREVSPPRSDTKGSNATFFKNAADFDVDNLDIKHTSGNIVDRRTTHVHRQLTHEKHYNQRGAVGVVNGKGRMTATINYGAKSTRSSKSTRQESESEEEETETEDETSSEDEYSGYGGRGARYMQKGAVGVVNDKGRFNGTINYNTPGADKRAKPAERRRGKAYTYDDRTGVPLATSYGQEQREYQHETPPSIGVQPSSPPQGPGQDTGGVHAPGRANPFQQQRSPWTPKLDALPEFRSPRQQQSSGYPQSQQRPPPTGLLSPLPASLGLQTPPATPGYSSNTPQQDGAFTDPPQGYVDRNPFRRMAAQAGQGLNGIETQMRKMNMNPQDAYPSPPLSDYSGNHRNAPQYS